MPHSLITQLRFTHSEFIHAVKGVSDDNAGTQIKKAVKTQ